MDTTCQVGLKIYNQLEPIRTIQLWGQSILAITVWSSLGIEPLNRPKVGIRKHSQRYRILIRNGPRKVRQEFLDGFSPADFFGMKWPTSA